MAESTTQEPTAEPVWEVPGHHWKEEDRVQEYVARTTEHADDRRAFFNLMVDLLPFGPAQAIRVLDIGSGYGALAAAVLDRFPSGTAVGLDISEAMMEVGRERMAQYGPRFRYHTGDFAEGALPDDLTGRFDAAVASASIHHLPSDAKRRLYAEIYNQLNPGGCFFNVDSVMPEEETIRAFYRQRREQERQRRGEPAPAERPPHAVLTHHHIETVANQVAWLRGAGFEAVDCFHKRLGQTIIGGFKPRS
jgi:tRNA (cmo5U34)-methyltransferase